MTDGTPITQLLSGWRAGDEAALRELIPQVYDELRRVARAQMRREREGHTLQPTALVHEAFGRLMGAEITWQDRAHFLSVAARVMRRVLVEHARARDAAKRGGGLVQVTLSGRAEADSEKHYEICDLDDVLGDLGKEDPRAEKIVELHYFGGLSYKEIAEVMAVSESTVERDLRHARAWLRQQLSRA